MTSIRSSVAVCFISALLVAMSAEGASLTVTSSADSGPGTLRQAISDAAASGDTINFAVGISAIDLTSATARARASHLQPGTRSASPRRS